MNPGRPYKLINRIQRYAWGKVGQESLVHRLLGSSDAETLAAELWIGAHPSAPSELTGEGGSRPLDKLIGESPEEWLGARVSREYGSSLPFLFKVLSIRTALSIQAHPDKSLAAELHERDPVHYPDANHKPEMAIAVTEVELLYGFRDLPAIRRSFSKYRALGRLLSGDLSERLLNDPAYLADQELLRDICRHLFHAPEAVLRAGLSDLANEIAAENLPGPEERWFLELVEEYPGDVGLVFLFLLGFVTLNPGEALFVGPNTPHAYLRGDLLECMASSDNVVRAGLTNKYKDVETLLQMLHFKPAAFETLNIKTSSRGDSASYFSAPAKEFRVEVLTAAGPQSWKLDGDSPAIVFCFEGKGKLDCGEGGITLSGGESAFLSPTCTAPALSSSSGIFYYVQVP